VAEKETEKFEIKIDSTELKIEKVEKQSENIKLSSFLEKPIDLQEFKEKKKRNVTTSVTNGMEYHFHPKVSDSIFYNYYYHDENLNSNRIDQITVFKYGQNKHRYDDQTETLIGFKIFNKDSDLGKANLVGLSKTELESEFGTDYLTFDNGIVYSYKNRVLIIELNDLKVNSYSYIKLNTEKVDKDLIGQIIK
jgi:hypothetical protein